MSEANSETASAGGGSSPATCSPARVACEKAVELMNSPTYNLVLLFSERMEAKLAKNRHKGDRAGWLREDIDWLLERLREEVCELDTAICTAQVRLHEGESNASWAAEQVTGEAADVANFAMMISDWFQARAEAWRVQPENVKLCEGSGR